MDPTNGIFNNGSDRNVIILMFIIVNYPMLTTRKMVFLILGEGPTCGINGSFSSPEE